jgi:predicted RNase H-like HicB family nuclease
MKRYLVVIERTETGFSAYAPDLPGCASSGRTRQEAETNIREALDFHIEGLRREGRPVPQPRTEYAQVEIAERAAA